MWFLHDSQIATIVGHGMKYRGRMMWWKTQNSFPAMKMNIWEDESGFMRTMPSAEKQLQYYLFATSAQSSKHGLLYFKVITEMISRILNLMASWEEITSITYAYVTTSLIQHAQSLCCTYLKKRLSWLLLLMKSKPHPRYKPTLTAERA